MSKPTDKFLNWYEKMRRTDTYAQRKVYGMMEGHVWSEDFWIAWLAHLQTKEKSEAKIKQLKDKCNSPVNVAEKKEDN